MIVRILDDGQYDVPEAEAEALDGLDSELVDAVTDGDDARYAELVETIVARVHEGGRRLPADHLGTSGLIVPGPHTTRAKIAALLERGEL